MKFFKQSRFILFLNLIIVHISLAKKDDAQLREENQMKYHEIYTNTTNNGHQTNAPENISDIRTSSDRENVFRMFENDKFDKWENTIKNSPEFNSDILSSSNNSDFKSILDDIKSSKDTNENLSDFSNKGNTTQENNNLNNHSDHSNNSSNNNNANDFNNSSNDKASHSNNNSNNKEEKSDWHDQARADNAIDLIREKLGSDENANSTNSDTPNSNSISDEIKEKLKNTVALLKLYENGDRVFRHIDDLEFFLKYKRIDLKTKNFQYGHYPEIIIDFMKIGNFKDGSKNYKQDQKSINEFSTNEILKLFFDFKRYDKSYIQYLRKFPAYNFLIAMIKRGFINIHFVNELIDLNIYNLITDENRRIEFREINKFNNRSKIIQRNWIKENGKTNISSDKQTDIKEVIEDFERKKELTPYPQEKLSYSNRIHSLKELANKEEITHQEYQLSPLLRNYLQTNSFDVKVFQSLTGNQLQHQCHKELLDITFQAADFGSRKKIDRQIKDLCITTTNFTNLGVNANKDGSSKLGHLCADAGYSILAFLKGSARAIMFNTNYLSGVLLDPLKAGKDIAHLARNVVFATYKVCSFILDEAVITSINYLSGNLDVEKWKEKWQTRFEISKNVYNYACKYFSNLSKEELFEKAGYIITDLLFSQFTFNTIGTISKEYLAARAISGQLIFEKLGSIGKETAKVIGLAAKHSPKIVSESIEVLKDYRHLVNNSVSKSIEKIVPHVNQFKTYMHKNAEYVKALVNNEKLRKFHEEYKVPTILMFTEQSIIPRKIHESYCEFGRKLHYFMDNLGNKLKKHQLREIILDEIELSPLGQQILNFMNNSAANKISIKKLAGQINKTTNILKNNFPNVTNNVNTAVNNTINQTIDVFKSIESLIMKNGKPIGKEGSDFVFELTGLNAKDFFDKLVQSCNAQHLVKQHPKIPGGYMLKFPTGEVIAFRTFSSSKGKFPTIDFNNIKEIENVLEKLKFLP